MKWPLRLISSLVIRTFHLSPLIPYCIGHTCLTCGIDGTWDVDGACDTDHSVAWTKSLLLAVLVYNCVYTSWHGGTVVTKVPHGQGLHGPGFNLQIGLGTFLCALTVYEGISSGCSGFLPQKYNLNFRLIDEY